MLGMKRSRSGVVFAGVWGKKKVCALYFYTFTNKLTDARHSSPSSLRLLSLSTLVLVSSLLLTSTLSPHCRRSRPFPSPLFLPTSSCLGGEYSLHSTAPLRCCVPIYSEMKSTRSTTPRSGFFCRGLQDDLIVGNVRDGHFRYTARRTHTLVVHTHITSTGTVHVGYPTPCRALVN